MRTEIANMEYGVDAPILFWQVNTICKPRNNVANGKRSDPMWSELIR